jgi:hypothetical protein
MNFKSILKTVVPIIANLIKSFLLLNAFCFLVSIILGGAAGNGILKDTICIRSSRMGYVFYASSWGCRVGTWLTEDLK